MARPLALPQMSHQEKWTYIHDISIFNMEATCSFETSAISELDGVTTQNNVLFTNVVAVKTASPYLFDKVQESSIKILRARLMLVVRLAQFLSVAVWRSARDLQPLSIHIQWFNFVVTCDSLLCSLSSFLTKSTQLQLQFRNRNNCLNFS
jgi:hypothetical protein